MWNRFEKPVSDGHYNYTTRDEEMGNGE
ncbi:uncharacterized protein METZ01_LOCUS172293 [marine metagenome]|uniref:Uncharacterized protein n=1 Tax=marine metagenome TaxID=408172 RepID=A0A382C0S4_9ZZZZ